MPVERRGQVTDVGSEPTGNRRSSNSRREAAAFVRWHEPDDARVSSPDLSAARGETPRADSATSWLKGVTLITSGMDERDERKRTSGDDRNALGGIRTGVALLLQEECGGNLPTGHA